MRGAGAGALGSAGGGERREQLDGGARSAGSRAVAGVAPALGRGGVEVDLADQQLLLELRGAREQRAGVVDDERVAVEDELVLAADERAERVARRPSRGRAARPSPRARGPCPRGRGRRRG